MKIAIIGGSGFVGTRLIEHLSANNPKIQIVNIDKQQSITYPEITKIADVRDVNSLEKAIDNDCDAVVLLAAEHRDDVSPVQLYFDVNVQGTKNVLEVMDKKNIKNILFTSSVAVFGLNKKNPNEEHVADPFNNYGKSKWQAEEVLREWQNKNTTNTLTLLRPTVIFGERNRGNVYNLLKQIASGRFMMIGSGKNQKSMAYVGNIVAFIEFALHNPKQNYNLYNYIDKPDQDMNSLVTHVGEVLGKKIPTIHIPFFLGICGGWGFDLLAMITRRKLPISSVRVRKFCATTQFDSTKAMSSGFVPPYSLQEGLARTLRFEFLEQGANDGVTFMTE